LWGSTAFKVVSLASLAVPGLVRTEKSAVAGEVNAGLEADWQTWAIRNNLPEFPGILTLNEPDPLWLAADLTFCHPPHA
jgi:hypothetical protein